MKKILTYLWIVALWACNSDNQDGAMIPPDLYPTAEWCSMSHEKDLNINIHTGDSIPTLINTYGDTVITGQPISAVGLSVFKDSIDEPVRIKAGKPDIVMAHPNVHKVPNSLPFVRVDSSMLKSSIPVKSSNTLPLINNAGDTIRTGTPHPIKSIETLAKYPRSVNALPFINKDNTINNLQYLDVDQGMSSSYVLSMVQDSRGNIWFGSNGGGLSKYDGSTLTHFTTEEGLSSNHILSLMEDRQGNIWLGTWGGGVIQYDGHNFIRYPLTNFSDNDIIWSMLEDFEGNIWLGTDNRGVVKLSPGVSGKNEKSDIINVTYFTHNEGMQYDKVLSIFEDSHHNLWFGTSESGVTRYDGSVFTHFTEKNGLNHNSIRAICEDRNGNIWIGTWGGGVSILDKNNDEGLSDLKFSQLTEQQGLSNNYILSILEDELGNIWIATEGGGVNKFDPSEKQKNGFQTITHFTQTEGLSNDYVASIIEDNRGNLWFGTQGGGVNRFDPSSFVHYSQKTGLSNDRISSILEDSYGNLWFGTWGGGVTKYDGTIFYHYSTKQGLSNDYVESLIEDRYGNIWFGTGGGGAIKFDGQYFTLFDRNSGLSNDVIWSMLEDRDGNIWFGTDGGGLNKYDGSRFTHYSQKQGLSSNFIECIISDRHGNLWLGTGGGGVTRYDGSSFTHITQKEGLPDDHVESLLEDTRGNIWLGTLGGGISKLVLDSTDGFTNASIINFSKKEGLSDESIWSILEGSDSTIWVGTERGLNAIVNGVRISPGSISNRESQLGFDIISFGKKDGLKGSDFINNSGFIDSKNRMWLGSGKSLVMLDLNRFKNSTYSPKPKLNHIEINEMFIDYRNPNQRVTRDKLYSNVPGFSNYPLELSLPHTHNHLTFYYNAIDWSAPHKVRYSYTVKGLSESWSQPSNETKADYRNMPYGNYSFKVMAIGESGIWSNAYEYNFTIQPPWWLTWWAKVTWLTVFLLLVRLVYSIRVRSLKTQRKQLQQKVTQRTQDLHDSNQKLIMKNEELKTYDQMISHDLKGPINNIYSLAELLRDDESSEISKEGKHFLEQLIKTSRSSRELIDGILIFASADQPGVLEESVDLKHQVNKAIEAHALTIEETNAKFNIGELPIIEKAISVKVYQLLYNLIGNALKFQSPGNHPEISISFQNDSELVIEDNGVGFDQKFAKEIFKPLKRLDNGEMYKGHGIGLGTCKRIVEFHNWSIRAESELGKGSKFIIRMVD